MKTLTILVYMFTVLYAAARAKWNVAESISSLGCAAAAMIRPPIRAAALNSIPRYNRPLPKNTVAKNRSSASPSRSRSTPMNHKNAIPANGTRLSARATASEFPLSHDPGSRGSAGTERRSSQNTTMSKIANRMPAIAPALGVLEGAYVRPFMGVIADGDQRCLLARLPPVATDSFSEVARDSALIEIKSDGGTLHKGACWGQR